ncbi:MAG: hypothetical protein H0U75_02935 [Legionella sp.]|nr:hypothetical protein [Legionella sp.]
MEEVVFEKVGLKGNFFSYLREKVGLFWAGLFFVLIINYVFKVLFIPSLDQIGIYSLVNTPKWMGAIKTLLSTDPLALLLPVQYPDTDGKTLWWTTTLIPFYYLCQVFSPLGVYLTLSSILIITVYLCSWFVLSSFVFSSTLAIFFALGTQLNYVLSYGVLLTLYLLLTYIAVNVTLCIHIFRTKVTSWTDYLLFIFSLMVCLTGSEYWLNYAVSLTCCFIFLISWAIHTGNIEVKKRVSILLSIVVVMITTYLLIENHAAHKYFEAGVEEELIFTYSSFLLMLDDIIVNYFTLLYMSLSNYLPSFFFFSNSLTYLSEAQILAEQYGYHAQKTHLIMASHIFEWRFYAGILFTGFCMLGWRWLSACWHEKKNSRALILFILWLAVVTGFSTHLLIKMRPYNSTPMLGYKALFSTFSFTILIVYYLTTSRDFFKNINHWRYIVISAWLIVLLSAFTRPAALNAGLAATGLVGYTDPAAQLLGYFKKIKLW